jgi:hypothetical protein
MCTDREVDNIETDRKTATWTKLDTNMQTERMGPMEEDGATVRM